MYASHKDACILSYYAHLLNIALEEAYRSDGTSEHVIAYRSLGKSNYHFSAEALYFAMKHAPCTVIAVDVTKFFDTLDHRLLKNRLKELLEVRELSEDWFAVYKHVTQFRHVPRDTIMQNPTFAERAASKEPQPLATMSEIKAAGIAIEQNKKPYGIPQGTPISSSLANLYMRHFDIRMAKLACEIGGFYRRYSDDVLLICHDQFASRIEKAVADALSDEKLKISEEKTEITPFDTGSMKRAQYLGFDLHPSGATIRAGSMSRQWRKMRKSVRRIKKAGQQAIAEGKANKIYTKSLRKRFAALPVRNFASYARRSAGEFGSRKIVRQARRLEREFEALVKGFGDHSASPEHVAQKREPANAEILSSP